MANEGSSCAARAKRFDRVVALDEFDLETAAGIREHMRIRGMGVTASAYFRDKFAMRIAAQESGFLVPEFCRVLNYDELRAYFDRNIKQIRAAAEKQSAANPDVAARLLEFAQSLTSVVPLLDAPGTLDLEDLERRLTILDEKIHPHSRSVAITRRSTAPGGGRRPTFSGSVGLRSGYALPSDHAPRTFSS